MTGDEGSIHSKLTTLEMHKSADINLEAQMRMVISHLDDTAASKILDCKFLEILLGL